MLLCSECAKYAKHKTEHVVGKGAVIFFKIIGQNIYICIRLESTFVQKNTCSDAGLAI